MFCHSLTRSLETLEMKSEAESFILVTGNEKAEYFGWSIIFLKGVEAIADDVGD